MGRIAPALFAYFFQPPSASGVFPYLQATPFDTTYLGQTVKEPTFGGIFACLPLLWILPFAKSALQMRVRQRKTRTIAGVVGVLIVSGVIIGVADAEVAGILQRYFADFSIMFLMAAVLIAFIINENLDHRSTLYGLFLRIMPVLGVRRRDLLGAAVLRGRIGLVERCVSVGVPILLETFQFWT